MTKKIVRKRKTTSSRNINSRTSSSRKTTSNKNIRYVKTAKRRKLRKFKLKKKFRRLIKRLIILIIVILIIVFASNNSKSHKLKLEEEQKEQERIEKENRQKEEYEACLVSQYSEEDNTADMQEYITNLNKYFKKNYSMSVKFVDTTYGYTYSYNSDLVYYAASTIKMLDAIYIYEHAATNEISLDDTVTYTKEFKRGASAKMSKREIGEKITLRELVEYAITVSDNTAHEMLVDYIGFNKLKNFGKSLGAKYTLVGGDDFGEISVDDAICYITELDKFIENNGELGQELKSYFVNSDQNYLGFEDENIEAAQKYGQYGPYYHSNGIVYSSNKYYVSILTEEGKSNYENVTKDINQKIRELQNKFYTNRQTMCYNKIYNEES